MTPVVWKNRQQQRLATKPIPSIPLNRPAASAPNRQFALRLKGTGGREILKRARSKWACKFRPDFQFRVPDGGEVRDARKTSAFGRYADLRKIIADVCR